MATGSHHRGRLLIGHPPSALEGVVWLSDHPDLMASRIERHGQPLSAAYVPVVLHEPEMSEAVFDAAEWAAEVLAGASCQVMALTPFVSPADAAADPEVALLSNRGWNHAMVMVQRLEEMARRRQLEAVVRSVEPDGSMSGLDGLEYVLDTATLSAQDWEPRMLSPSHPLTSTE